MFCKIASLEISQNSQENTCARVSFLTKEITPEACNFIKKETLAQVFSSKFCEISKKTFCYRTLLVAASDLVKADVGLNTLIPQKEMLLLEGVWGGS